MRKWKENQCMLERSKGTRLFSFVVAGVHYRVLKDVFVEPVHEVSRFHFIRFKEVHPHVELVAQVSSVGLVCHSYAVYLCAILPPEMYIIAIITFSKYFLSPPITSSVNWLQYLFNASLE